MSTDVHRCPPNGPPNELFGAKESTFAVAELRDFTVTSQEHGRELVWPAMAFVVPTPQLASGSFGVTRYVRRRSAG